MCSWWALRSSKPLFWLILEGGFDSHTLPQKIITMKINILFNYLIKILWLLIFFLIIFLNREDKFMVIATIFILLVVTILTVVRAII